MVFDILSICEEIDRHYCLVTVFIYSKRQKWVKSPTSMW